MMDHGSSMFLNETVICFVGIQNEDGLSKMSSTKSFSANSALPILFPRASSYFIPLIPIMMDLLIFGSSGTGID